MVWGVCVIFFIEKWLHFIDKVHSTTIFKKVLGIQIKICAEYWNMLPKPKLVCQEPGLRLIGLRPGVPDKSSRALGSMSRYSAQILICFIAYIFQISIPLWVWLRTLQNCHPVHRALCHCPLQSKWGCSSDNQISQHALLRCSSMNMMKTLSGSFATELMQLTDKLGEICINGKFSVQEPSEWRILLHACE